MRIVGRYALHDRIAAGGMATVHLGRLAGEAGFTRTVAIKRLHPHLLLDPAFADMFADEARVAARIRHPNVVPTLDVVRSDDELLLVMEYVDGESLSQLFKTAHGQVPLPVALAIVTEILHGLHAAHEARDEEGRPLCVVHRDVSPQNVLVGADGVARLVDFGIARAAGRRGSTNDGDIKGKIAYMAPEQIRCESLTRQTDVFAAGVVLWELLTGQRLFASESEGATLEKILVGWVPPPSSIVRDLPPELDAITLRALDPMRSSRWSSARDMAIALEDAMSRALPRDVGAWVEQTAERSLRDRRRIVARIERGSIREDEGTDPLAWYTPAFAGGPVAQLHTVVMPTSTLPPRPQRSRWVNRAAMFVCGLALAVGATLLVQRPSQATATTPVNVPQGGLASLGVPAPVPIQTTAMTSATQTAQPIAYATASTSITQAPTPAPSPSPRIAPAPKRAFVVAKKPCTAHFDSVTKKTTYQGDCE